MLLGQSLCQLRGVQEACGKGSPKPHTFPEAPCMDAKPFRPHILGHGPASHYPQPPYREGSLQEPGVHR